jgi:hypothetical protein
LLIIADTIAAIIKMMPVATITGIRKFFRRSIFLAFA